MNTSAFPGTRASTRWAAGAPGALKVIVTFLMVFLIQRAQNKDALAVQLKLNEIVAALEGASNRLISVEDLSEQELRVLHIHFQRLAEMARTESHVAESHSIEEAEARHAFKKDRRKRKSA